MIGQKCISICLLITAALTAAGCASPAVEPLTTAPPPVSNPNPTQKPENPPTPPPFSLAEPGPHFVGRRQYTFAYPGRESGTLGITVWYPALKPEGYTGTVANKADPDRAGAPYPLLLSSTTAGNEFAAHLVSYGFVAIGVDGLGPSKSWGFWLIDFPQQILAALDYAASGPLQGLEGMIDANRSGVYGYSFDGYDALALSGARIDQEFYLKQCAGAAAHRPPLDERWVRYICTPAEDWQAFRTHAGEALTRGDGGLWQPMTDERIRAAMPMAPEGAWLFGERGLAAVDRPVLLIGASEDLEYRGCPYPLEAVPIFERIGVDVGSLITFIGQGHLMIFDVEPQRRMNHFAVAFFGYHLQDRADYAAYFSKNFVNRYPDLAWGPVFGE